MSDDTKPLLVVAGGADHLVHVGADLAIGPDRAAVVFIGADGTTHSLEGADTEEIIRMSREQFGVELTPDEATCLLNGGIVGGDDTISCGPPSFPDVWRKMNPPPGERQRTRTARRLASKRKRRIKL